MKLRIGCMGILNRTFPGKLDEVFNRFTQDTELLSKELDFELISADKALDDIDDVKEYLSNFKEEKIDFLLVQLCSFSSGKIMEAIGRSGFPLGLWGIPEPASKGVVQLNSLCGLNMFCSINRTYLKNEAVKQKWFFGGIEDREFISRFKVTINALKTIKKLKELRAGIVGGIAPGFLNVYADKRKLQSRFGIEIREYDFSELQVIIEDSRTNNAVEELADKMAFEVDSVSDSVKDNLEENAIVYNSIRKFAETQKCDCLAISCWPQFRKELGVMPCAAYGRLTDNGIVSACEGDIEGSISMFILQSIAENSPMIMDFTHVHPEKGAIQYWHCGNAPASCGKQGTVELTTHFKPGSRITCEDDVKVGFVYDMIFEPGEYTVFRLMDDGAKCLLISGEILEDELGPGFEGTRGWLGNLKYNRQNLPFWDFINTIMSMGIPHHHCLVKGNIVEDLAECMKRLGVEIIEPVSYQNMIN